jgi:protoheme IX farnesyltransferase
MSMPAPSADAASAARDLPPATGARAPAGGLLRDLFALTKPRLSSLVLFTAGGGVWLSGREVDPAVAAVAVLGTTLVVGGANALNCYLERDIDARMARTQGRPLPGGRLHPQAALAFGLALSMISVPLLTLGTTPLAGLLAAVALVTYVLIYTPLKRRSSVSLLAGAVPGAMPPLIGWTAASGQLELGGLLLFLLIFLWQIPHSLAIGIYRREEYEAAGLVVFPNEYGMEAARRQAVLYSLPLIAAPALLVRAGVGGAFTLTVGGALGVWFVALALQGYLGRLDAPWARRLFFASLVYLTGVFAALAVDHAL